MGSIYVRLPRELEVLLRSQLEANTPAEALSIAGELLDQLEAFARELAREVDDVDVTVELRRLQRRLARG